MFAVEEYHEWVVCLVFHYNFNKTWVKLHSLYKEFSCIGSMICSGEFCFQIRSCRTAHLHNLTALTEMCSPATVVHV